MKAAVGQRKTLSVTVITKNEADRIRRCLDSVAGWVDQIVVLDSGSDDDTVAIAKEYTQEVYETDWPGYGVQKQRALDKATGDWVLSIDADEAVTDELRQEIETLLDEGKGDYAAYRLPWGVTIYGKCLNYGRSARSVLRLFRREGASFTSAVVHETVVPTQGKIGKMRGRLLHFTHRDFGHALYKNADYGWLGAQKRFEQGKKSGLLKATIRSLWTFFHVYILRLGFLDGRVGYLMAVLYAQVAFNKYAGLWTLLREHENDHS